MTVFKGKTQGFQWLSKDSVGFALVQLDSEKVALFSGDYKRSRTPDISKAQLYAPDFFRSDPDCWWDFECIEILEIEKLENWAQNLYSKGPSIDWREPPLTEFASQVQQIEKAFEAHEVHKAVPTVFSVAQRGESDPRFAELLAQAILNRGQRLVYALVTEEDGVIGATPEVLFEFDKELQEIKSMALAGTRASEAEPQKPLLNDPKELHEHNLVLMEVKKKLEAFGEVSQSETYSWDIGALTHLRTDLSVCELKPTETFKLFNFLNKALHPTPALGLSSETVNFTWLKTLPGARERFRFGAPFGILSPDFGAKIYVAIRNIQWNNKEWLLGSGCGYVPQSKIDKEWKELELKRASVKSLFESPK